MGVSEFALAVVAFCYATNGSVTSWGRTAKRNSAVGGHPNSWHLNFLAADVVYDVSVPEERAKFLAGRHGLRLVREATHDHLQPDVKS